MSFEYKDDGIIEAVFWDGGKFAYGKAVDFRAFYKDMHTLLKKKGFKDTLNVKNYLKGGELPSAKTHKDEGGGRTSDMYEKEFKWFDKGDGAFDIEIAWEAQKGSEIFKGKAKVVFKLALSNRNMKNKEILEGNNKITLQDGGWEHRNKLIYTNTIMQDKKKKFKEIPILSNEYLEKLYLNMFIAPKVEHDITLIKRKIVEPIQGVIDKHFL